MELRGLIIWINFILQAFVNIVLNDPSPSGETYCVADINEDNVINVLDVVELVNIILN